MLKQDEEIDSNLRDRIKEIECLYAVSSQFEKETNFKNSLNALAGILKNGFRFPQKIKVTIYFDEKIYGDCSSQFHNDFSGNISYGGKKRGEIRIRYNSAIAFHDEEKKLLLEICERLSREAERLELRKDLVANLNLLESLVQEKNCEVEECNKLNDALKKMTHELSESRKQLEMFFSAITETILVIDSKYNIVMSNRPLSEGAKTCYMQFYGKMAVCAECPAKAVFSTGEKQLKELKIDSSFYIVKAYPVLSESGTIEQVIIKYNDVTKEKQLEEHLVQSNKLASIGKLVAGIAHEINNPNTFLHGNLVILREGFSDLLPIIDREYEKDPDLKIARLSYDVFRSNFSLLLDDMVQGTDRIKAIVDGLKHFARKNEDSMMEEIDLNEIVEGSLHLVENELKRHVEITCKLSENLPHTTGNSQKLEQVVINLLINASQATSDKDGAMLVRTGRLEEEKEVYIQISDNGCGIDEKTRENIFDPFFTTKRGNGGTGLGLSLSYGIVKEHRGRIVCDSEPGKGATFTVYLPITGKGKG